jgi:hypothetical protein
MVPKSLILSQDSNMIVFVLDKHGFFRGSYFSALHGHISRAG